MSIEHTLEKFRKLPKFLIANDGGDRDFVIHCHDPQFFMQMGGQGSGVPIFIDSKDDHISGAISAGEDVPHRIDVLLNDALEFFNEHFWEGD